jgi:hypothetical protein
MDRGEQLRRRLSFWNSGAKEEEEEEEEKEEE